MSYQTVLVFNKQLLRQTIFEFWRRSVGVGFMVALIATALSWAWLVAQSVHSWVVGAVGTVLIMAIVFAAALYAMHYRAALQKLREIGHSQITFCVEESCFTITSGLGITTLQWSVVKELWQLSGAWLLLYSKAQFSILPLSCLTPEMQIFIVERVQAAGGKIGD